jgi:hypothetical protein
VTRYISLELRRLVANRADSLCEYCLIPDADGVGFQIDHIISVKHGGVTTIEVGRYPSSAAQQRITK